MRYEDVRGLLLPKVGFGTWSIGGRETADTRQDSKSLAALHSALALGYTHFDTAESYANGHCEELLGRAIHEARVARESLFITSKVKPRKLTSEGVIRACEASLVRLESDYLDLYLIHWPSSSIRLEETFRGLNQLITTGKIRHVGVSNFDLGPLKGAQALAETPLLTNQVPMSIVDRSYVSNGVFAHCQASGIVLTAYSPLKHASMSRNAAVAQIAASRGLTPQQIGVAWLCSQPSVITIPMSVDPKHQRENLEAADVMLTAEEMRFLG